MKMPRLIYLSLFFIISSFTILHAQTYYFTGAVSSSWINANNWETACSAGSAGAVPDSLSDVIICAGKTVNMDGNPGYCRNITLKNGAVLNFPTNTRTLNALGDFTVENTSSITGNKATRQLNISGKLIVSAGIFSIDGITMNVTDSTLLMGGINVTSGTGTKSFGNVKMYSGSSWNDEDAATYPISGNFIISDSSTINGNGATSTFNIAGDLICLAAASTTNIGRCSMTISGLTTINGDWVFTSSASGTKQFNGGLIINGSWDNTVGEGPEFNGTHDITNNGTWNSCTGGSCTYAFGKTTAGTINLIGNPIQMSVMDIRTGTTVVNQTSLTLSSPLDLTGSGTLDASTYANTVIYSPTGNVSLTSSPATYHHLTIKDDGGSRTITLGVNTTVNGNLTISNTARLDVRNGSNYGLDVKGNWSVTSTNTNPFNERVGTVTFSGTGTQTLNTVLPAGETFNNLTINKSDTLNQLCGTITVAGTLTMTSGVFNTQTNILTGTGGLTASGGELMIGELYTTNPGLPRLSGGYAVIGGTINFSGNGNQLIRSLNTLGSAQYASIKLSGSGNKTLNGSITVIGDFTNDATLEVSTNTVSLRSGATQIISGDSTSSFYNLTINKTANGVTINSPVDVSNTLTLTQGIITNNSVFRLANTATTTIGNNTSYISGPLVYNIVANATDVSRNFPVGKDSDWRPFTLTVNHTDGSTESYVGELFNSNAYTLGYVIPPTIDAISMVHYWDISRSGGTNLSNASVKFYYSNTDGSNDVVSDPANLGLVKDDHAGNWVDISPVSTAPSTLAPAGDITSSGFSSFSKFALANKIGGTNSLPIELTSFNATLNSKKEVDLVWSTSSETNNDFFTLEKTKDGLHFSPVCEVKGYGNSNQFRQYSYTDFEPYKGVSYYRLKQTDFDGKESYSDMVSIENTTSVDVKFFPNPYRNDTYLYMATYNLMLNDTINIRMYDIQGREVFQDTQAVSSFEGENLITYKPKQKLEPGSYIIMVFANDEVIKKIILVQ